MAALAGSFPVLAAGRAQGSAGYEARVGLRIGATQSGDTASDFDTVSASLEAGMGALVALRCYRAAPLWRPTSSR